MNMNNFTARAEILGTDQIAGKRGIASVGEVKAESTWTFDQLLAFVAASVSGITVVSMPANSAATGAVGQIASDGATLAIYVGIGGGPNWIFIDCYQK